MTKCNQKILVYLKHKYPFWCISASQVDLIKKNNPSALVVAVYNDVDALREIQDADIYFGWNLSEPLLEVAQKLHWVHTPAAGRDYIDSPLLRRRAIEFTNSEGYHGLIMAQHAMGMMLYFSRGFSLATKQFWPRQKVSEQFFDLNQAKILIVGCGSIGLKLAELCQAFKMQVSGYRRTIPKESSNILQWVDPNDLNDALAASKIIVNLLPGNAGTFHFFNTEVFSKFSKGSVFINLGRGRTVDENALLAILEQNILLGCGLDVLENEPPTTNHALFASEKVLITPHSSAFTHYYLDHAVDFFCKELLKRQKDY